jgi:hypothetical protein
MSPPTGATFGRKHQQIEVERPQTPLFRPKAVLE